MKKKSFKNMKTTSFLAEGTDLDGKLTIKGGIRIDGKLKGEIQSESVVYLGDTARIRADIEAAAVISSGRVVGDIKSALHVELRNPGALKGTIHTRELVLEKGVSFDGFCKIIEQDQ